MPKYIVEVEGIKDLSAQELKKLLINYRGIKLSELSIKDLVFYENEVIESGNGVYIFKEKSEIIYIGKCSSRNFVERIPAHFDTRHNAWFNSLLLHLTRRDLGRVDENDKTKENYTRLAKYAFENLELILINFRNYDKQEINKLERLLRLLLLPLNKFKKKRIEDFDFIVSDYIQ